MQPFGVVVGKLTNPSYIIVVEDNQQYSIDTGIRALELLFKLLHALDISYPVESAHIWQFIEKSVFKMKSGICSQASMVLTDISYHMEKGNNCA